MKDESLLKEYQNTPIMMDKDETYKTLVADRKNCIKCANCGLVNSNSNSDSSIYDHTSLGAWNRWQSNLNAPIMVIGREWGTLNDYIKFEGHNSIRNKTDLHLSKLFQQVLGIDLEPRWPSSLLYFTNAALCYIEGSSSNETNPEWYSNCSTFLKRQIELINPEVIICLGKEATYATFASLDLRRHSSTTLQTLMLNSPYRTANKLIFPVYHPSPSNNLNRKPELQLEDWKSILAHLKSSNPKLLNRIKAEHDRIAKPGKSTKIPSEFEDPWIIEEDISLESRKVIDNLVKKLSLEKRGKLPEWLK